MIHLGDITKIKGHEAPVVDCIIGGSPCQDLSVVGKRAGLAGERSGLFMEQIRVIKEMRDNDSFNGRSGVDVRPRYGIWENVPGALSSPGKGHAGEDFAAVLEEFVRVAEPEAPSVSVPEKGWPAAGCLYDEMGKWSVAWRIMDSQYWGVPQRRRRICLVADFNGLNAPKIVFGEAEHHGSTERCGRNASVGHSGVRPRPQVQPVTEGLSGNLDSCQQKGQETARDAGNGIGGAVPYTLKIRGGCEGGGKGALIQEDKSATLSTLQDQTLFQPVGCNIYGLTVTGDKADTLTTQSNATGSGPRVIVPTAFGIQGSMIGRADKNGPQGDGINEDVSFTLNTTDRHAVVYGIGSFHSNAMKSDNPHSGIYEADTSRTLDALNCGYPGCNQGGMAVVQPVTFADVASTLRSGAGAPKHESDFVGRLVAQSVAYNGSNITSPINKTNPQPGDPCHTLTEDSRNYLVANRLYEMQAFGKYKDSGIASSVKARDYKGATDIVVAGVDCRNATEYPEMNGTIQAKASGGFSLNCNQVVRVKHIVRRLTPLECERLQGFPDGWTDIGEWVDSKGKKHKEADSPRYKALGNSIALPPWKWVLKRLCACYERDATMASLFDGIGGFPLIWEQINGKGSCLWASEIEEFPMAVTKARFGE